MRKQLLSKFRAEKDKMPPEKRTLVLTHFPRFLSLLEEEIYDVNSPIWDPEFRQAPPAHVQKEQQLQAGSGRSSDSDSLSIGLANVTSRKRAADDDGASGKTSLRQDKSVQGFVNHTAMQCRKQEAEANHGHRRRPGRHHRRGGGRDRRADEDARASGWNVCSALPTLPFSICANSSTLLQAILPEHAPRDEAAKLEEKRNLIEFHVISNSLTEKVGL